jgi:hypothetical protein
VVLFDLAGDEELAGDGIAAVSYDVGIPPAAGKLMLIVRRVAGLSADAGFSSRKDPRG